jgi:hypothetical protein
MSYKRYLIEKTMPRKSFVRNILHVSPLNSKILVAVWL